MEIKKDLLEIVQNYCDAPLEEINGEDNLKVLGLNSYVMLSMVCEIEDHFGIQIPDEDLKGFSTLNSIVDYISAKSA